MSSTPLMDRIRAAQINASHSSDASEVIRDFQAWAEYRSGTPCNYDALRAVLHSVRGRNDITVDELKAAYLAIA